MNNNKKQAPQKGKSVKKRRNSFGGVPNTGAKTATAGKGRTKSPVARKNVAKGAPPSGSASVVAEEKKEKEKPRPTYINSSDIEVFQDINEDAIIKQASVVAVTTFGPAADGYRALLRSLGERLYDPKADKITSPISLFLRKVPISSIYVRGFDLNDVITKAKKHKVAYVQVFEPKNRTTIKGDPGKDMTDAQKVADYILTFGSSKAEKGPWVIQIHNVTDWLARPLRPPSAARSEYLNLRALRIAAVISARFNVKMVLRKGLQIVWDVPSGASVYQEQMVTNDVMKLSGMIHKMEMAFVADCALDANRRRLTKLPPVNLVSKDYPALEKKGACSIFDMLDGVSRGIDGPKTPAPPFYEGLVAEFNQRVMDDMYGAGNVKPFGIKDPSVPGDAVLDNKAFERTYKRASGDGVVTIYQSPIDVVDPGGSSFIADSFHIVTDRTGRAAALEFQFHIRSYPDTPMGMISGLLYAHSRVLHDMYTVHRLSGPLSGCRVDELPAYPVSFDPLGTWREEVADAYPAAPYDDTTTACSTYARSTRNATFAQPIGDRKSTVYHVRNLAVLYALEHGGDLTHPGIHSAIRGADGKTRVAWREDDGKTYDVRAQFFDGVKFGSIAAKKERLSAFAKFYPMMDLSAITALIDDGFLVLATIGSANNSGHIGLSQLALMVRGVEKILADRVDRTLILPCVDTAHIFGATIENLRIVYSEGVFDDDPSLPSITRILRCICRDITDPAWYYVEGSLRNPKAHVKNRGILLRFRGVKVWFRIFRDTEEYVNYKSPSVSNDNFKREVGYPTQRDDRLNGAGSLVPDWIFFDVFAESELLHQKALLAPLLSPVTEFAVLAETASLFAGTPGLFKFPGICDIVGTLLPSWVDLTQFFMPRAGSSECYGLGRLRYQFRDNSTMIPRAILERTLASDLKRMVDGAKRVTFDHSQVVEFGILDKPFVIGGPDIQSDDTKTVSDVEKESLALWLKGNAADVLPKVNDYPFSYAENKAYTPVHQVPSIARHFKKALSSIHIRRSSSIRLQIDSPVEETFFFEYGPGHRPAFCASMPGYESYSAAVVGDGIAPIDFNATAAAAFARSGRKYMVVLLLGVSGPTPSFEESDLVCPPGKVVTWVHSQFLGDRGNRTGGGTNAQAVNADDEVVIERVGDIDADADQFVIGDNDEYLISLEHGNVRVGRFFKYRVPKVVQPVNQPYFNELAPSVASIPWY